MNNPPSPKNFLQWFDPRRRQPGMWAFSVSRVTALGLTAYLALHLLILGKLAQGSQAYDTFIAFAETPAVKMGELLVVAGGLIHGLNCIRVGLTSLGIGVNIQRQLFWIFMSLAAVGTAVFGYVMFFVA